LDGYFIAKIEIKFSQNQTLGIRFKRLPNEIQAAIIVDNVFENEQINLVLIKGLAQNLPNKKELLELPTPLLSLLFAQNDLTRFLEITGDKNPIHYQKKPVVPGLLILNSIFENTILKTRFFEIKYMNPLFLESELNIYQITENELIGIANGQIVFHLFTKN
jgi:hypothetical protein